VNRTGPALRHGLDCGGPGLRVYGKREKDRQCCRTDQKLDGTAKGGVVVTVRQTMKLPVKFIGIGEQLDDLQPFDADTFVESLFT